MCRIEVVERSETHVFQPTPFALTPEDLEVTENQF